MPIDPIPAPPTALDDPNFVPLAAAFFGALPTLRSQINSTTIAYGPGAPFCTAGGTANAITLTTGLSLATLVAGQSFSWVAPAENTTAVTINPDGLGATATKRPEGGALPPGWIRTGELMGATYDGTSIVVYPSAGYLAAREAVVLMYDGAVPSTSSFTWIFGTAYRSIEIDIHNLVPATAGSSLFLRLGNGSGVMEFAVDNYEHTYNGSGEFFTASLPLTGSIAGDAGFGASGEIKIFGAASASTRTRVHSDLSFEPNPSGFSEGRMRGGRRALTQHQSFMLLLDAGNFSADRITVRGVK